MKVHSVNSTVRSFSVFHVSKAPRPQHFAPAIPAVRGIPHESSFLEGLFVAKRLVLRRGGAGFHYCCNIKNYRLDHHSPRSTGLSARPLLFFQNSCAAPRVPTFLSPLFTSSFLSRACANNGIIISILHKSIYRTVGYRETLCSCDQSSPCMLLVVPGSSVLIRFGGPTRSQDSRQGHLHNLMSAHVRHCQSIQST